MSRLLKEQTQNMTDPIEDLIAVALQEDLGERGDISTRALISPSTFTSAKLILKERAVVCGLPYIEKLFKSIDPDVEVKLKVNEGTFQIAGTVLAKISGPAWAILTGERTLLNFLQHASGVATVTASYVRKLRGLDCDILDTRKTLPGLRALEQYAVRIGGGVNHRRGLDHIFIIKRNHLAYLSGQNSNPITYAIKKVQSYLPDTPVEIELCELKEVKEAVSTKVDSIMLDHMTPVEIQRSVKLIRKTKKRVYLECAGAITLDTIRTYAETGVDGIATSELTYLAEPIDIRLRLLI